MSNFRPMPKHLEDALREHNRRSLYRRANLEVYSARYDETMHGDIVLRLTKAFPSDVIAHACNRLVDACVERTLETNPAIAGFAEIELRKMMTQYMSGTEWSDCLAALKTYLARFNASKER